MKVKYTVSYDNKDNCIIGRFSGEFNKESMKEYLKEIVKLTKINNCNRFINDLSRAHINVSIIDLYSIPEKVNVNGFDHKWKRAVIVKEIDEDLGFFETTAKN